MFGVLTADLSLESMGIRDYDLSGHIKNQLGLVPVVLVAVFTIYFIFTDRVGLFLAPRGIQSLMIPLGTKLSMLGIVTPLLVDTMLVGYFVNQTGHFPLQTLMLWGGLMVLACVGTWMAWRNVKQSIAPMQMFLTERPGQLKPEDIARLVPHSLDEFGVLTRHLSLLLGQQHQLMQDLEQARSLSQAVIETAGMLLVVLDREGRIVRFNLACEQLSGHRFEEVQGKLYPPESE
jgi:PAS domain-containing protein